MWVPLLVLSVYDGGATFVGEPGLVDIEHVDLLCDLFKADDADREVIALVAFPDAGIDSTVRYEPRCINFNTIAANNPEFAIYPGLGGVPAEPVVLEDIALFHELGIVLVLEIEDDRTEILPDGEEAFGELAGRGIEPVVQGHVGFPDAALITVVISPDPLLDLGVVSELIDHGLVQVHEVVPGADDVELAARDQGGKEGLPEPLQHPVAAAFSAGVLEVDQVVADDDVVVPGRDGTGVSAVCGDGGFGEDLAPAFENDLVVSPSFPGERAKMLSYEWVVVQGGLDGAKEPDSMIVRIAHDEDPDVGVLQGPPRSIPDRDNPTLAASPGSEIKGDRGVLYVVQESLVVGLDDIGEDLFDEVPAGL